MRDERENFLDSRTLAAVVFLIVSWLAWDHYMRKKYPPAPKKTAPLLSEKPKKLENQEPAPPAYQASHKKHPEKTLKFEGKNMEILFSSQGLGIKRLKLINRYDRQKKPIVFASEENPLFSARFLKATETPIPFEITKQGKELFVGLFAGPQGTIKKTVQVDEERFILKGRLEIKAKSLKGLSFGFSHPLPKKGESSGFFEKFLFYGQEALKGFVSYRGDQIQRIDAEEMKGGLSYENVNSAGLGGKYFGKAWINNSPLLPSAVFQKSQERASARVDYEFLRSAPKSISYKIFLGPKSLKSLQGLGGDLSHWLDFGFFGWLARPLLLFLNGLYKVCHNWGLAIILLTVVIRLLLLPINMKSYKSMKIMQKIQPQIKEIKEKHKDDPKKANQDVMALMRENKASPLGCLPLFLQIPIFIALYRVLGESIELYQSPFVLWIKDLSLKDPYYALPILAGLVYFIQQSITPMSLPKEQARLIKIMPLIFSVFMLALPSGLTLYLFVSGLFGLAQQFFFVKISPSHL